MGSSRRIGGAPISWGVSEVPGWGYQLKASRVLDEFRAVGLRAIELGPPGFLPDEPAALKAMLQTYNLQLIGGFLAVVVHRPQQEGDAMAAITQTADLIAAAGGEILVLAAAAGDTGYDRRLRLSPAEWATLAQGLARAEDISTARRLTLVVHPHVGTVIEGPEEIYRLLEITGAGLCLDTGHLLVGGADLLEVTDWAGGRIRHVHLKDVDAAMASRVRSGELSYHDAVGRGLYRPLGSGDIGAAELVRQLEADGYTGWYVLEQDVTLATEPAAGDGPMADVKRSLDFIRRELRV